MPNNIYNGDRNDHSDAYRGNANGQNRNMNGYYNAENNGSSPEMNRSNGYTNERRSAPQRGTAPSGGRKPNGDKNTYKLRIILTAVLCLLAVGLVVLVVVLLRMAGGNNSQTSESAEFSLNLPSTIDTSMSETPSESVSTPAFLTDAATTTSPVTNAPETTAPVTDKPYVPDGDQVDNSFFSDAIFIGDSRVKGLMLSGDISCDWYATESLHINTALTNKFVSIDGVDYTIKEALAKNPGKYKKVYIGLGVNDLGYAPSNFIAYYKNFVSAIKEVCPGADIYAMAVIPVSKERSDKNLYGVTNEKVSQFNAKLSEAAGEMGVIFLNVAEPFTRADGTLVDGTGSPDGVHLGASGYKIQCAYIRSHTKK